MWSVRRSSGVVLWLAVLLSRPALAADMTGTWLVIVDGMPETRLMVISGETPGEEGAVLQATYGITTQAQVPVQARLTRSGEVRQLSLVTQASSSIVAKVMPDGSLVGTFTLRSGRTSPVTLTRVSDAQLARHRMPRPTPARTPVGEALPAGVVAGDGPVTVPARAVGDTWTWAARVHPRDQCTSGIAPGATVSQTVVATTSTGYVSEVVGPQERSRYLRAFGSDMSYAGLHGQDIFRIAVLQFPIEVGRTWSATLAGTEVVTTLRCQALPHETVTLDRVAFKVAPVRCEGNWKNMRSGNSDQATYTYWYSAAHRHLYRWTVSTRYMGGTCAEVEYALTSFATAEP